MAKNKNLTLLIVKFNIILTMGGEFYLPLQRFYNGVGGVLNYEF
jgi:hypothetical protein